MSNRTQIRFAKKTDEERLVVFLKNHWRADHIFVTHPNVLRWQHEHPDASETDLTFVIAEMHDGDTSPEIMAVLGFIPFRRFDASVSWNGMALAIWKVREDAKTPGLGIQMLKLLQRAKPEMICAIGISNIVRPMYQALGYKLGTFDHVALFAQAVPEGQTIASGVPQIARAAIEEDNGITLEDITIGSGSKRAAIDKIDALAKSGLPRKSWTYLKNRYFKHPYYSYTLKSVIVDGTLAAVLVWRRVETPFGALLRIVDVIGEAECLSRCGGALRAELIAEDCDYIDLMSWGVDVALLCKGGFVNPQDHQDLILPNYFSPFVRKNIQIEIAVKLAGETKGEKVRLYRADSDQDRPATPEDLLN